MTYSSSWFPGAFPHRPQDDLRNVTRTIVGQCPVCGLDFVGHSAAELSRVIAGGPLELQTDQAVATSDWTALISLREWDVEADIIEYQAIRCSRLPELGLVRILFRAELWSDDDLQLARRLSIEQSQRLAAIIDDRWRPL